VQKPVTDNVDFIEHTNVFESNGKIYLLTDDVLGTHTFGKRSIRRNRKNYVMLWEETAGSNGEEFLLQNAKLALFQLNHYVNIDKKK
jgi:hypothetical protein